MNDCTATCTIRTERDLLLALFEAPNGCDSCSKMARDFGCRDSYYDCKWKPQHDARTAYLDWKEAHS